MKSAPQGGNVVLPLPESFSFNSKEITEYRVFGKGDANLFFLFRLRGTGGCSETPIPHQIVISSLYKTSPALTTEEKVEGRRLESLGVL